MNNASSPTATDHATPVPSGNAEAWLELARGLEVILVGLLRLIADRLCLPDRLTAPFLARLDRAMQRLKHHLAALAAGQVIPQHSQRPSSPARLPLGLLQRLRHKTVFLGGRLAARLAGRFASAPIVETAAPAPTPTRSRTPRRVRPTATASSSKARRPSPWRR